ncbi:Uma2 family endonuclease [Streptomonospora salina]|uniref:Uma2 family endonuclease n=1 Tax=Streptomonospora salina TaxID=104205 RepID=A0A841EBT9_9ACTN|nr:Uma2 family endonuclease [Streptomonospora salina]MBB5997950.1 Uma2 family endonuclease [Streptomonospora salina]
MSIGKPDPPAGRLTVQDLARTPDDGRRYELADGKLDVSPAPVFLHTLIEGRLCTHLGSVAPSEFAVLPGAGINLTADRTRHRVPDPAVIRLSDADHPYLTRPPALAVEVVSPESVFRDNHTKRREYAEFGIESYWIVAPEKEGIMEFRLDDDQYVETAQVYGDDVFETDFPFPLKIVPTWLTADGPWKRHIGGE